MSSTFNTKVNGSLEFTFSEEEATSLDTVITKPNAYHLLVNNTSYHIEISSADFLLKNYNVKVNNTTYEVAISDDLDKLISEMGFSIGGAKHVNDIKAPMPGLILDINIKEGQEVKEDDPLLVLEAMKMENVISSPRDGVIKSIVISQGQAVDKNALLIEFE
ncbi:biotin/lipoyl-containing protein [Neptunitalea lumnitzerae]|uniref:Lipoyl-binding domain-containing protein n=1 Tax=Neptunitalea lumnitzerae TaxID=2965509 RepID=A0ABQ5MKY7_9FLAO|nr:biotin/lipoyl-containing protein [Neptunitalea sp. Y10]GLB50078.1 hypothetical protein Y10_24460 [Neptunitalea sp. Y10]